MISANRFLAFCVIAWLCLSLGTPALADVILDWNAVAIECIRTDNTGPTMSTRNLAILHTAIYDAVNSITRNCQPYRFQLDAPSSASADAAAVAAAHEVLLDLYPSYAIWSEDLYGRYLASAPAGEALTNGLKLGRQIAQMALDSRRNDGSTTDVPYIPSDAPGQWRRTPPFFRPPVTPQWEYVDTFCLAALDPYLPEPPPTLDSSAYAAAFNEVKAIGGKTSTLRTPEQSQIAVFWSDFSYTSMPPGHWHLMAADIARERHNSLEQNARLFALLSLAQADAAIVCWAAKYQFNLWRPVTAIQRADEDGNPATDPDPTWNSYLASPPFPSYTSGHSTFSKAAAEVIKTFYGTDAIHFNAESDSLPGVVRSFESLAACADEIGMSRIYGGIHYQFDNIAGKMCGQKIAEFIDANYLLPNVRLPFVRVEGMVQGVPQLRVQAQPGSACVLQASSDLKHWTALCTNSVTSGGVLIGDTSAGTDSIRFYRVFENPGH